MILSITAIGISIISLLLTFYSIFLVKSLKTRIDKIFPGETKSMEDKLNEYFVHAQLASTQSTEALHEVKVLEKRMKSNFQKFALVKYNPYNETGGNLSFALTVLDENNNGFIINALHSREITRVYSKQIEQGKTSFSLSVEEKESLNNAIKSTNEN